MARAMWVCRLWKRKLKPLHSSLVLLLHRVKPGQTMSCKPWDHPWWQLIVSLGRAKLWTQVWVTCSAKSWHCNKMTREGQSGWHLFSKNLYASMVMLSHGWFSVVCKPDHHVGASKDSIPNTFLLVIPTPSRWILSGAGHVTLAAANADATDPPCPGSTATKLTLYCPEHPETLCGQWDCHLSIGRLWVEKQRCPHLHQTGHSQHWNTSCTSKIGLLRMQFWHKLPGMLVLNLHKEGFVKKERKSTRGTIQTFDPHPSTWSRVIW